MIRRVMGAVRSRMSPRTRRVVRALLLAWGWVTADLRPPPELVVVGAQRAGTTTIFRLLSEHPDLVRPTADKGTGYFDDHFDHSWRWYRAHFPVRLPGRRRRQAFECSGYYLFHPLAAERIAAALPRCQVVVMVRDPVARAHSAHKHELARGFEELPFEQAVAQEADRTAGLEELLRTEPGSTSFAHRHHAYLQRGEYATQIGRFVEALGPGQVHVVDADALFADPVTVWIDLQRRLGLRVHRPQQVGRWNERPGGRLAPDTLARLRRHFEPHDAALVPYLGGPPSWREEQEIR
ncbi:sulfotransferase domain-containing protein [Nocardioides sp. zg-ZUI104]|uniref:sulfotransferase domain-containing protein n=1 Tax=Nocardioides faecalis TaxID=2803858 RepID=UPI001BCD27BE|nr:sulfotransferase domain-containing protein [Nocardioides faecalis]MBS4752892.1 sulfotransferase domain-containing protein [Nocardioides faecalis]